MQQRVAQGGKEWNGHVQLVANAIAQFLETSQGASSTIDSFRFIVVDSATGWRRP